MLANKKSRLIAVLAAFIAVLSGCTSFVNSDEGIQCAASISGSLCGAGLNTQNVGRYAYAEIASNGTYKVTAACGEKTAEGTVSTGTTYTIPLENTAVGQNWTVTATYSVQISGTDTVVLSGTKEVQITEDNPYVSADIYLSPVTGNGSVNLSITLNDANNTVTMTGTDAGKFSLSTSGQTRTITAASIAAGSYSITLSFYGDESILLYTTTQTIIVYAGLKTNIWCSGKTSGDSTLGPINSSGKFIITSDLIQFFARSTFYVDSTNGNDGYSGSWYSPVKTLERAVTLANNSSSTETTKNIYVKNGQSESVNSSISVETDLNIEVYTSTAGDKTGKHTIIRGPSSTDSMIKIAAGKTVSITGLVIDGSNTLLSGINGAGINNCGALTLTNSLIKNCKTSGGGATGADGGFGGGIYSEGNLTLNGTIISSNSAAYGSGLYKFTTCIFTISGSTWFSSDNDIFLVKNNFITLANETLVPADSNGNAQTYAAVISLAETFTAGDTVISASTEAYLVANIGKFDVKTSGWEIVQGTASTDTKKTGILIPVLYVAGSSNRYLPSGSDSNSGKKTAPFATLNKAISSVTIDNTTIYIDGITTDSSPIDYSSGAHPFNISKYNDAAAQCNFTGAGTFIKTNKAVTFTDIILDGGGSADNCAIWALNNEVVLSSTTIQNFKGTSGAGSVNVSGVKLTAAGKVTLSGTSKILNSTDGAGIYSDSSSCTVTIKDSAYLDASSYINLGSTAAVTIASALTPLDSSGGSADYVAVLKPFSYTTTDALANGTYLYSYFDLLKVRDSDGAISSTYYITCSGKLNQKQAEEQFFAKLTAAPTDTSKVYIMDSQKEMKQLADWVDNGSALSNIQLKLNSDITLGASWSSIGTYINSTNRYPFSGSFDGNNKTISYSSATEPLFDYTSNATIANVKTAGTISLTSVNNSGAGTVVNYLKGGTLSNCESSTTVNSSDSNIGGIVGKAEFASADRSCIIENCINTGSVTSSDGSVGGIAGTARSVIIRNCYNSGAISGTYAVGGIAGFTSGNNSSGTDGSLFQNCGNTGNVNATSPKTNASDSYDVGAGGIAGGCTYKANTEWRPTLNNCWSSGTITASSNLNGGIIGHTDSSVTMNSCYYFSTSAYGPRAASTSHSGASSYTVNSTLVSNLNNWATTNSSSDVTYKNWKVNDNTVVFQ